MTSLSCDVRYGGQITRIGPSGISAAVDITSLLPKEWNEALRETWSAIGWHLFDRFVDKHFTKEGAEEYRGENVAGSEPVFQARSGEGESGKAFWKSYNGRKQKAKGHQLAMVFSGDTRNGAKRVMIYATSKGVRVALPGCVHLNRYKPRAKQYGPHAGEPPLDLRADLLAISRREAEDIRAMHERLMVAKFGSRIGWYAMQVKN